MDGRRAGRRHVSAARLLRTQPAGEQHQPGNRQEDHEHQNGRPRFVEVKVVPGQTNPVAEGVLDHRDQLFQRDHTMLPTSAADLASAPAVRTGQKCATRSFLSASVPRSRAASSADVSSCPFRPYLAARNTASDSCSSFSSSSVARTGSLAVGVGERRGNRGRRRRCRHQRALRPEQALSKSPAARRVGSTCALDDFLGDRASKRNSGRNPHDRHGAARQFAAPAVARDVLVGPSRRHARSRGAPRRAIAAGWPTGCGRGSGQTPGRAPARGVPRRNQTRRPKRPMRPTIEGAASRSRRTCPECYRECRRPSSGRAS